jgi:hypothetical protein
MFRGYAVALAAALLLTVSAEAKANRAVVRGIRGGSAEITKDGKIWKTAKVGDVLGEHSAVKTDASATVDLFLGDNGPVVRVTKDTTMGIDRLDVEGSGIEKVIETQLDLRSGKILGNVKKMAAASKYEVKTPVGVAGIRGTEYAISADGKVTVFTGTVVVVYIVNNVPQPPVTIQGGSDVLPPLVDGGNPRVTSVTIDPDINTLTIGITTDANGNIVATGTDSNGNPIIIRQGADGVVTIERPTDLNNIPIVVVPSTVPSNFDTTTGDLTRTKPTDTGGEEPPENSGAAE